MFVPNSAWYRYSEVRSGLVLQDLKLLWPCSTGLSKKHLQGFASDSRIRLNSFLVKFWRLVTSDSTVSLKGDQWHLDIYSALSVVESLLQRVQNRFLNISGLPRDTVVIVYSIDNYSWFKEGLKCLRRMLACFHIVQYCCKVSQWTHRECCT